MDTWSELLAFMLRHRGKVLGALIGLVAGFFLIWLGFIRTLILLIFLALGYRIGMYWDQGEDLDEWWRRWRRHSEDRF